MALELEAERASPTSAAWSEAQWRMLRRSPWLAVSLSLPYAPTLSHAHAQTDRQTCRTEILNAKATTMLMLMLLLMLLLHCVSICRLERPRCRSIRPARSPTRCISRRSTASSSRPCYNVSETTSAPPCVRAAAAAAATMMGRLSRSLAGLCSDRDHVRQARLL